MVDTCPYRTEQRSERAFAELDVVLHVSDVIEVQHSYAGHTNSRSECDDLGGEGLRLQVITADGAQQTKEKEDSEVAETYITVRMFAERIFDGAYDGQGTKPEKDPTLFAEERTEGRPDQRRTKDDAECDKKQDHVPHLWHGDRTGLQPVRFPARLIRVRTFDGIPEFVAEVTENLQAEGRTDGECEDESVHLRIRQTRAEDNARHGEW